MTADATREPTTLIVHALRYGLPLCGFSNEVPRDWPAGHRWTQIEDIAHITCAECQTRAARLLNTERRDA